MALEEVRTAASENSGTILSGVAVGVASFWALVKAFPLLNKTIDNASQSVSAQGSTLAIVIEERDKLRSEIKELRHAYESTFGRAAQLEAKLLVAEEQIRNLIEQIGDYPNKHTPAHLHEGAHNG
jgi:uncharacterized coiled-coil DUF342 family protein